MWVVRRLALFVVLAAVLVVPAARADGDPASDVLYFTDVFTSYEEQSKPLIDKIQQATAQARAAGTPIKVAVIWSQTDLGAVPQLFGKPKVYAKFLAAELDGVLTGPLVIAMPAGFGVWVADESKIPALEKVLAQVTFRARTVDELTQTATAGVNKLRLSFIPPSGDARAPSVRALAASARLGAKAKLRFRIADNSGKARALVRVYGARYALYANLGMPLRTVGKRGTVQTVTWRVPRAVGAGTYRFCVLATDKAGNASKTSCAKLTLKKKRQ